MNKLKMKIKGYDDVTHSLLVSFASDESQKSIDEYSAMAYQPCNMFPDVSDPQELLRKIATSGVVVVEQQKRQESASQDPALVQSFKNMVGQTFEYDIADIYPAAQTLVPLDQAIESVQV
jgi:hypothetical protein